MQWRERRRVSGIPYQTVTREVASLMEVVNHTVCFLQLSTDNAIWARRRCHRKRVLIVAPDLPSAHLCLPDDLRCSIRFGDPASCVLQGLQDLLEIPGAHDLLGMKCKWYNLETPAYAARENHFSGPLVFRAVQLGSYAYWLRRDFCTKPFHGHQTLHAERLRTGDYVRERTVAEA